MAPDHRRPARADEDQTGEPVRSTPSRPRLRHADPAWHRRLGSALNWVGDRVAVVGADPAGAVAAGAAGLPAEPGVVTVVSPLTRDDDWSVVEMVLPIAVPPGSRARLAVADAAGRKLAGRLARELTATVDAPQGDLLLVPGGSLFAVDGWWRHTVDGATAEVGRRCPLPDWEGDLDALCADPGDSPELTLVPLPAGIWAYPSQGEASAPALDDPAYDIPMDVTGPVLVVGRPGHPEPTVAAVTALLDRIPPSVRQRLVLVPYGAATAMVEAGAALAREAGHEVHLRTGLPALTPDGRAASRVVDGTGVGAGLGTGLVLPPVGPASPTGPVRGLDGYPVVEEYVFRLSEHWVAEVTQSGLWVRRAGQETGARVVRGHRWTFGRVRIFVGVPGQPPGHDVLPVLGALLARMPAETRRLVDLVPDEVAVAAPTGDDASSGSTADEAGPVVQLSTVLGRVSAGAARTRSVPSSLLSQPVSAPSDDAPVVHRPARVAAPVVATVPAVQTDEPGVAAQGALPEDAHDPQPTGAESTGATLPDDATAPLQTITAVPGVAIPPAPAPAPAAASTSPSVAPTPVPAKRPRRELAEAPAARRAGRRRAAPALAATAVLAVATASGYGLSSVVPRSGAETPAQQSPQPVEAGGPAPHVLPEVPDSPVGPNGETPVLAAATPEADPAVSPGATLGTDPLAVPGAPVGVGPVVGPAPQAGPGGGVVAAPQAPPAPGATRSTAARPPAAAPTTKSSPAAGGGTVRPTTRPPADTATQKPAPPKPSVMPGLVNSSGRNLALNGTASASSVEVNAVWDARYAIDGDSDSRWSSSFNSDPQWLSVDLGAVWQVTEVRLMWERAYATAYRVEVSTDGRNWKVVYRTTVGSGGTVTIDVPRTPARYVRMVGTARVMQGYGYSLHEVEIR